jgi:hypothetical protein
MGDIVMNLAIEYAKAHSLNTITDKALEYAYETLGIEPEDDDYINEGGIYGMQNAFSPKNLMQSLGRNVLSGAAKKAISSSGLSGMIGPGLLLGGALMLGRAFDPTRPGSRNYNPALAGQIEYATRRGLIGTNPGSGLQQYGPNSVLAGQNVKSMFGTNDYQGQLQNNLDYFENRIALGKPYSQKNYAKTLNEISESKGFTEEKNKTKDYGPYSKDDGGNNDNDNSGDHDGGASADAQSDDAAGAGGYNKGGIAGINRNRGQLGETLYG